MEEIILQTYERAGVGKIAVRKVRSEGYIPAVVYGRGETPKYLKINVKNFITLQRKHHLKNTVIGLDIQKADEQHEKKNVILKELQRNALTGLIMHIDFNEISLTDKIIAHVVIHPLGEAVGVRRDGGIFDHPLRELEIKCLPTAIPQSIEMDISSLTIGHAIHVRDLIVPEGIEVLTDKDAVVFTVHTPKAEEVPVAAEPAAAAAAATPGAPAEPEVIKKGKEEKEKEEE